MATVLRTLERGWQWEDRQCSRYHTIRYDTIEEINVDSKAEYTA